MDPSLQKDEQEEKPTMANVHLFTEAQRQRIDILAKKMTKLDDTVHIWVRDASEARHDDKLG
jgi:hypothetical protein